MGVFATLDFDADATGLVSDGPALARPVLVVEDGRRLSRAVGYMCDYLGLAMRRVATDAELAALLALHRPIAVVSALEGRGQDGCHVMKLVAAHDRTLPVLLVTGRDPALIGAAEAVEEACGLAAVRRFRDDPGLGDVVEFLLGCGRFADAAADRR